MPYGQSAWQYSRCKGYHTDCLISNHHCMPYGHSAWQYSRCKGNHNDCLISNHHYIPYGQSAWQYSRCKGNHTDCLISNHHCMPYGQSACQYSRCKGNHTDCLISKHHCLPYGQPTRQYSRCKGNHTDCLISNHHCMPLGRQPTRSEYSRWDCNHTDYLISLCFRGHEWVIKFNRISGHQGPSIHKPSNHNLYIAILIIDNKPWGQSASLQFIRNKTVNMTAFLYQLEQLERLCFEIPTAAPWLPILVIHIRSQVKTRQSQSYKLKKIAKNANF